jgi:hypothetical protein
MTIPNHQAITPKFKEAVQAWIAKDKQYLEYQNKANQALEERDKIASFLIPYICQNGFQGMGLNLNGNRIAYKEKIRYDNNTFGLISDCIKTYFQKDEEEAQKFITYMKTQKGKHTIPYLVRNESKNN